MKRLLLPMAATALFALILPLAASAANSGNQKAAQQEVSTAHAHAVLAASADSLKMTHAHLHHVINCLEGSKGDDFSSDFADPCKGMGQGALSDAAGNAGLQQKIQQAIAAAMSGLQANQTANAHQSAKKAAGLLSQ